MRFERVDAHAFGPFSAHTLELAPGLNVVFGPNEAGKSSWHAALYAGLCGMRRAKGQVAWDRAFRERHRPWSGDRWEVGVLIRLADGRRVELRHDLDARMATVRDADLGRDLAAEILNEGAPDGAVWLGLDRETFLATVCVRQAELALAGEDADGLQSRLQRAATSARESDPSAACAIEALREFRREWVGLDRAGSQRPLRAARDRHERARRALEAARSAHEQLDRETQAQQELEAREHDAASLERELSARIAERAAHAAEVALARARELATRHVPGSPAPAPHDHERLAAVTNALAALDAATAPAPAGPERASELAARLAALGAADDADRELHPSVSQAARDFDGAQLARERAGDALSGRRDELARDLSARRALRRGLVVAGAGALVAAAGLASASYWSASLVFGALALGFAAIAALRPDSRLAVALARVDEDLAHQARLDGEVERAAAVFADALAARNAPVLASVGESLIAYREACAARAHADEIRRELERALPLLLEREQREAAFARAHQRVAELARECGVTGALVNGLRAWHADRLRELPARDREIRERTELAGLLAGADLGALERRALELRAQSDRLGGPRAGVDPRSDAELGRALVAARKQRDTALEAQLALEARLAAERSRLASVAEAEEELARAHAELERVTDLDAILEQTEKFLEQAQDSAHRSIAPLLAADLCAHLPHVTRGRWQKASVDPADLAVQLAGADGAWRPLANLSHGTREQVWLLLRVALARRLVRQGETSPLLLDDVTVHFDRERTAAALEALREIARERQVILFTQEEAVLHFAREQLRGPDDRVIELPPPPPV